MVKIVGKSNRHPYDYVFGRGDPLYCWDRKQVQTNLKHTVGISDYGPSSFSEVVTKLITRAEAPHGRVPRFKNPYTPVVVFIGEDGYVLCLDVPAQVHHPLLFSQIPNCAVEFNPHLDGQPRWETNFTQIVGPRSFTARKDFAAFERGSHDYINNCKNIRDTIDSPVVLFYGAHGNYGVNCMVADVNLGEAGLYGSLCSHYGLDDYQIAQTIAQWFANRSISKAAKVPPRSDIAKVLSHGFDAKQSFRHRKAG